MADASGWTFDDGNPANEAPTSHGDWEFDDGKPAVTEAPPETAARVAGLATRALAGGTAGLVSLPFQAARGMDYVGKAIADPIRHAVGLGDSTPAGDPTSITDLVTGGGPQPYKPQLSDFVHPDRWQKAAEYFAEKAGAPTPQTSAERIGSAAVSALPSAVFAPEAPVAGALWSAAGGAASQATAEAGGNPVAQTIAGLAVGGVPAVGSLAGAATRALTRGGASGQAAMAQRLADAVANGTQLTAGQATGSRLLQGVEAASSRLWGGGPIHAAAEAQAENIGTHVDHIVENLSQGAEVTPTTAGEAINTGVGAAKQSMRQAERDAYDKVDTLVPADHPVDVSATLAKLDTLATPTAGAEATTGALVSPKIAALRDNLASDLAKSGGTLPYSAARQVRTAIGNSIDWGFAPADPVANGALKQAYGTLGGDLDAAASAISPEARQAVKDASTLYATNQAKRDLLNTVVDKAGGPEAVYQAATNGTKLGATKIAGVMDALDPQSQNLVRATVLSRLGRAIPSQQNAAGAAFNPETFLTNWNKLAPEAKDALFGTSGNPGSLRAGLDSLANTTSTIRGSTIFKNPSNTAGTVGHSLGLWALLSEGAHSFVSGPEAMVTGAGAIAGNAILSRVLTNPKVVKWLASSTKLPTSALPNAVNQLAKLGDANTDPDAQDLAAYLRARGVR
jgi:hypothetical protein